MPRIACHRHRRVPEESGVTRASRYEASAIRTERDTGALASVQEGGPYASPGADVPEPCRAVRAPRQHEPAIETEDGLINGHSMHKGGAPARLTRRLPELSGSVVAR